MDILSNQQIIDSGLDDWRKLEHALHARFTGSDFRQLARFVGAVADAAEIANHHPDVRLTYGVVDVSVCSHDAGMKITRRDIRLASDISRIAAEHGLTADPASVTQLEVALDTAHEDRIAPFWSALLTGAADNLVDGSVVDSSGRVPQLWFQDTDEHETPRQRFHFDLWLPPETVEERVAAAVAAGGEVMPDECAPTFTVLCDPDGNRACICFATGRES